MHTAQPTTWRVLFRPSVRNVSTFLFFAHYSTRQTFRYSSFCSFFIDILYRGTYEEMITFFLTFSLSLFFVSPRLTYPVYNTHFIARYLPISSLRYSCRYQRKQNTSQISSPYGNGACTPFSHIHGYRHHYYHYFLINVFLCINSKRYIIFFYYYSSFVEKYRINIVIFNLSTS